MKDSEKETEIAKKRYDRTSIFYNIMEYPIERLLFSKWRARFIPQLKGRILEVGVGTGKNLKYYSDDARVTGIDISLGMLKRAIKEANRLKRNYSLLQMDAQNLKFEDNSFDCVICTFLLCSVPDPVKALKEMRRVCKSDGKIIMLEHMLSRNRLIALFENLHNPITSRLFGFNMNRDTVGNIRKAGLKILTEKNLAVKDVFRYIECKK